MFSLCQSLVKAPDHQGWIEIIKRDTDRQFPFHEMFQSKDGHGYICFGFSPSAYSEVTLLMSCPVCGSSIIHVRCILIGCLPLSGLSQKDLLEVLKAYTQYRPDEGYCQAQGPVAAVLLMNMPAEVFSELHTLDCYRLNSCMEAGDKTNNCLQWFLMSPWT